MMTIEEIESACNASEELDFTRHDLDTPELPLRRMFYPFGFPTEVRTNSVEILEQFDESWAHFKQRFETEIIRVEVNVVEDSATECPPEPTYRIMQPLLVAVADSNNYSICDFSRNRTQVTVSASALLHKSYLRFFFLEATAGCHIATRFATPVHAGCVELDGRGVLLCGDSGAGKSTLSYALARSGWGYVTDDCSFLLNCGRRRIVTGNCHQVRFRPAARELFPEVADCDITPRAAGKPSIQLPTSSMLHVRRTESVQVDFVVFLNRKAGPPELRPYRKDVARYFMRQVLFGSAASLAVQYAAIDRLLTTEVFELRYSDLDWAAERLQTLVRQGR
jgi:hypothetical protein